MLLPRVVRVFLRQHFEIAQTIRSPMSLIGSRRPQIAHARPITRGL